MCSSDLVFGMPQKFHYGDGMGTNPIQMMQALSAQVIRHKRVMKENCVIICSSICNGYFHDERWPYLRELYNMFQHDYMQILPDMDRYGEYFATNEEYIRKYRFANAFHPFHGFSMMSCGHLAEEHTSAIYIVGAREPSPYGEKVAARLGLELARNGVLLVSGIAQGIDSIALKGALQGGGRVVSVLGGGVDVPYPWQNRYLYEDVAAAGALISEYPPGTRPNGEHFPVRNRIISGLALGVVAVECARHSGTMLTVNHAMEQNRDVFAIPGNIDAPMSEGPNWLLRQGARPVTCAQDILEEYVDRFPEKLSKAVPLSPEAAQQRLEQVKPREERQEPSAKAEVVREVVPKERQKARFTDDQLSILHTLGEKQKTYTADELVELTQIPARRVLSALTMLQVDGAVQEHPGRRFSSLVVLEE